MSEMCVKQDRLYRETEDANYLGRYDQGIRFYCLYLLSSTKSVFEDKNGES